MATRKPTKKAKKAAPKSRKPAPKKLAKKAAKKKPVAPKRSVKAAVKKKPTAAKKAVAKKPAAKKVVAPVKKPASPRQPPMHARQLDLPIDPPEHEHDETFEIFKSFDRDGSGSIDRAELTRLLEALNQAPSEDDVTIALSVVDANDSGRISWDEFKAWWNNR